MRNYLVNPGYIGERTADYELLKKIKGKFKPISTAQYYKNGGGNGNLCSDFYINAKTKKTKMASYKQMQKLRTKSFEYKNKKGELLVKFQEAISSAMLMYRLACLFPGKITTDGQEGYKFVWSMHFKHVETGEVIGFGEWKGGALFWTQTTSNKELIRDLKTLIEILISDNCPHPYDGLVAGRVA